VRPKTGEVVWKHQVLPRDNWDQECTFEMMIINTPVNPSSAGMLAVNPNVSGGRRKTLGLRWQHNKAGARKMHDYLAGARVMPADGDVL